MIDRKSGTRDSNPRLRPWQFQHRLKIEINRAYVVHSCLMNSPRNHAYPFSRVVNGVQMGYDTYAHFLRREGLAFVDGFEQSCRFRITTLRKISAVYLRGAQIDRAAIRVKQCTVAGRLSWPEYRFESRSSVWINDLAFDPGYENAVPMPLRVIAKSP